MPVRLSFVALALTLTIACDEAPPVVEAPPAEPPAPEVKAPEAPAVADPLRPLDKPESVLIDGDRMWISVIGGSPADQNDDGRIMTAELTCARAQGVAACLKATGIDGAKDEVKLDGPKGMARIGDWLYVADIDKVRRFNAADGKQGDDIPLAGATFVNDLVADGAGGHRRRAHGQRGDLAHRRRRGGHQSRQRAGPGPAQRRHDAGGGGARRPL